MGDSAELRAFDWFMSIPPFRDIPERIAHAAASAVQRWRADTQKELGLHQQGWLHLQGSLAQCLDATTPHDATESLFDRDTNQRKTEAVERMGRISDLNRVGGKC